MRSPPTMRKCLLGVTLRPKAISLKFGDDGAHVAERDVEYVEVPLDDGVAPVSSKDPDGAARDHNARPEDVVLRRTVVSSNESNCEPASTAPVGRRCAANTRRKHVKRIGSVLDSDNNGAGALV